MHTIAFVLLPVDTTSFRKKAKSLLAPYNRELEISPHKHYLSEEQIGHWTKKLETLDLQKIAAHLTKNAEAQAGVDERGLYEISTFNHRGQFDYWGIADLFEEGFKVIQEGEDLSRSLCLASQLPKGKQSIPYSIVTPEGEWFCAHDHGVKPVYDWTGRSHLNSEAQAKWDDTVGKLLKKYQDHLVFALDVHS